MRGREVHWCCVLLLEATAGQTVALGRRQDTACHTHAAAQCPCCPPPLLLRCGARASCDQSCQPTGLAEPPCQAPTRPAGCSRGGKAAGRALTLRMSAAQRSEQQPDLTRSEPSPRHVASSTARSSQQVALSPAPLPEVPPPPVMTGAKTSKKSPSAGGWFLDQEAWLFLLARLEPRPHGPNTGRHPASTQPRSAPRCRPRSKCSLTCAPYLSQPFPACR